MDAPISLKDADLFHVTTKGGEHWVIAWHPDYGSFFERIAVFIDGDRAEEYLKSVNVSYTLDGEIELLLPDLMKDYPRGVRCELLAEKFGVNDQEIRKALRRLHYEGRAQYVQAKDKPYKIAAPKDYHLPEPGLGAKQAVVFDVLKKEADGNGIVKLSRRQLSRLSGATENSVTAALESLEKKGYVLKVDGGSYHEASTYQVLNWN